MKTRQLEKTAHDAPRSIRLVAALVDVLDGLLHVVIFSAFHQESRSRIPLRAITSSTVSSESAPIVHERGNGRDLSCLSPVLGTMGLTALNCAH